MREKSSGLLVGENIRETPGLLRRSLGFGQHQSAHDFSGASEINLTFVVEEDDMVDVVQRLHREFFSDLDPAVFA